MNKFVVVFIFLLVFVFSGSVFIPAYFAQEDEAIIDSTEDTDAIVNDEDSSEEKGEIEEESSKKVSYKKGEEIVYTGILEAAALDDDDNVTHYGIWSLEEDLFYVFENDELGKEIGKLKDKKVTVTAVYDHEIEGSHFFKIKKYEETKEEVTDSVTDESDDTESEFE